MGIRFIVSIFISIILLSNLRFSSMYLYYGIAKEDFIERLCENKNRPELNCDGKCALSKMLQADLDNEKEPLPQIGWEKIDFFINPVDNVLFNLHFFKNKVSISENNFYNFYLVKLLGQPPQV